ncbi:MAG: terminase small subunit [Oscillospiraceae bacterium]
MINNEIAAKKATNMQIQFAYEYAQCGNATEAARRAGYKQPAVKGCQLLKLIGVKNELKSLTDKLNASKKSATEGIVEDFADRIAGMAEINAFWTSVIRGEIGDKVVGEDGEVYAPTKISDRLKASELRAKVQGAFIERQESKTTSEITVTLGGELEQWAK